jgi:hypothetical protein
MRKASTRLPEQGTQAPSPAPDLIPAETENQPGTYTEIGTANGGTSLSWKAISLVCAFYSPLYLPDTLKNDTVRASKRPTRLT